MWKYVRRYSPSVMPRRPRSSWNLTMPRIASSSTARNSRRVDRAGPELLARIEQELGSQEAADMVGAKRGRIAHCGFWCSNGCAHALSSDSIVQREA